MTTKETIFVVDDDAALRRGLTLSLEEWGFEVLAFESAERFLKTEDIDRHGCLLLDVRMPRTTGPELQEIMLERGIDIPIIFITAHGDIPTTVRAMHLGAVDFLEKPYDLAVLLQRIKDALARDRVDREQRRKEHRIRSRFALLTPRECEVLIRLVAGSANASNRLIAGELGISHRTVDTYRARIMSKMEASSLPELVDMARACGVYESTDR